MDSVIARINGINILSTVPFIEISVNKKTEPRINPIIIFLINGIFLKKGVYNIKICGKIVDEDVIKNTLGFYLFYIFIFIFASILISTFNFDLVTSLTASASSIGNIGPGLGLIGPMDNWGHFPPFVKP